MRSAKFLITTLAVLTSLTLLYGCGSTGSDSTTEVERDRAPLPEIAVQAPIPTTATPILKERKSFE